MSFEGVGETEEGLHIWRIEDFEAVPLDVSKYGKFHTGDSYIVLKTTKNGNRLEHHIHFWLGSETTQDEAGTAAIKSVELDDLLVGGPVQHREVQEHESSLFISYFMKGIHYLPGGIKSGFCHVETGKIMKRLFHIKGKRQIKVKQVALDASLLNKSDCWILDQGKGNTIIVFMPPGAGKMEKFRANQAANDIRDDDHSGNAKIEIIEELTTCGSMLTALESNLTEGEIPEDSEESDEEAEKLQQRNVKLYMVSDAGGEMELSEVGSTTLSQDMLVNEDCFILDTGSTCGIFVWIGKHSNKDERLHAMKFAEDFLAKNNLPSWTNIERVVQGGETTMFKQFFTSWTDA